MTDLSQLSDEQLKALYSQAPAASPLAGMSDEELIQAHQSLSDHPAPKPFNVLPFSEDENGKVSFDIHAGLPGALLRAFMAPYDALTGKFDPLSPEGQARAREAATFMTPMNPAVRAGDLAVPGLLRSTRAQVKTPTAAELKTAANQGYDAVRATGAEYPGQAVGELSDTTQRSLQEKGFLAELAPKTFAVLSKLANPPEGSVVTISSLDAARKALNKIGPSPEGKTDYEAAQRVIAGLDSFIERLGGSSGAPSVAEAAPPAGIGAANGAGLGGAAEGNPAALEEAARLLPEARGNAAARFRSDRITGKAETAENRAASANSGLNIGNTLRQRITDILASDKLKRGYSQEELGAMQQIVRGTATANTLRRISNLLGGGGGLGQTMLGVLGAAVGANEGGLAGATIGGAIPPLLGAASRRAYNGLERRQLRNLDEMVRQRSPLYQQRLAASPLLPERSDVATGLLLRGLLGTPGGLLGDPNQP